MDRYALVQLDYADAMFVIPAHAVHRLSAEIESIREILARAADTGHSN